MEKKWKDLKITTVEFSFKHDIKIIDISKIPASPSVFDTKKRDIRGDLTFLRNLIIDLTKPVTGDRKVHIEYVPTKIATEFILYGSKQKLDGVGYLSSRDNGNNTLVLFYDHIDHLSKLHFFSKTLKTQLINFHT